MDMQGTDLAKSLRDWDAQTGSKLRGALLLPLTAVWAILASLAIAILATLFPRWFRRRGWCLVRLWGRVPLFWYGVRLEVSGAERLRAPGAKLVIFNHVSVLDLFVLAAVSPTNAVVIYKQEFRRVPGIGHALRGLGCIPVDRSNSERARESLAAAADLVRATGAAVMMAPEGTRSRKGGLQEFKLGAFHLAQQTGAPLVPLIMRGIEQVSPMRSLLVRSGRVAVDFLAPIDPSHWTPEEVRARANEVRGVFLEYLEPTRTD